MRTALAGLRAGSVAVAAILLVWLVFRGTSSTSHPPSQLPPWFGDQHRPATEIAGRVFGAPSAMTVHLLLDVPDPMLWRWRQVRTSATGEFDFGVARAGRYRLFANGNGSLSRFVRVDTTRHSGERVELFARELTAIPRSTDAMSRNTFEDYEWESAYRLSTKPITPFVAPGLPMSGVVVTADGRPVADVGVQPIECGSGSHDLPDGMDIVATTTEAGGFAFVPYADHLCGVRVWMGPLIHEVALEYPNRHPLLIRLPPPGGEQTGVFNPGRRDEGDPRGAWLRGHVVRNGAPAADIDIGALVLPHDNIEVSDETRSRSDGSFELFISSKQLDTDPIVLLSGWNLIDRVSGWEVVRLVPGQTRADLKLEVGNGTRVSGTLLDERGFPMSGIRVGTKAWDPASWSEPTTTGGYFQLTIHRPGRYRLHAFVSEQRELTPAMGRFQPQIDVAAPSGEIAGLRLMFSQRDQHIADDYTGGGIVDLGAEIRHGIVIAVRDELAAAGLNVGDEVVAAHHSGVELEYWEIRSAARVRWGEEVELTVKRGTERMVIRARAPLFGSQE